MWYNPMMTWLLRSPLHPFVSKSMMLVTVTGRKSGKRYTVPVGYVRSGDTLTVVSRRGRTWWRNLRGGKPFSLHLQGREVPATAAVVEDEASLAADLARFFEEFPQYARYLRAPSDANGRPTAEGLAQLAETLVMVRVELSRSAERSGAFGR